MYKPKKIIGIFGGMGPDATVDFYKEIIRITPAKRDQEHIPVIIYSLPQVPDRTECIKKHDDSIIPYLKEGVKRLEYAGASFICIPCNTAHYYFDHMQSEVSIPILHMISETVEKIKRENPSVKRVGLLATIGTIESCVYEKIFKQSGFDLIVPEIEVENEKVMRAIYGIKSGRNDEVIKNLLKDGANHLIERGAELIVLGCTEIPLAFDSGSISIPVVNATRVLAEAAVKKYFSD